MSNRPFVPFAAGQCSCSDVAAESEEGVYGLSPGPPDRFRLEPLPEAGDELLSLSYGGLHGRQRQRGLVALPAVPDLREPERVFVGVVLGDDVVQVPLDVGGAVQEYADQLILLAGGGYPIEGLSLRALDRYMPPNPERV